MPDQPSPEPLATRGAGVRPEALARARGRPAAEGLDWLGRQPDGRLGSVARIALGLASFVLFRVAAIRVSVDPVGPRPVGGAVVAVAVHRGWIDPLVVIRALPSEPRPWFIGSGPSLFRQRWREAFMRHVGGLLPVWRGGLDPEVHVTAARAVVDAGCPMVVFVEGAVAGEPDRIHRVRAGIGLLAIRLGDVPIVPLALAGSEELYRRRRISVRRLTPVTARELAGADWPTEAILAGSRDELRLARLVTDRLAARLQVAVTELHPGTVDPPDQPRRWRWLGRLF